MNAQFSTTVIIAVHQRQLSFIYFLLMITSAKEWDKGMPWQEAHLACIGGQMTPKWPCGWTKCPKAYNWPSSVPLKGTCWGFLLMLSVCPLVLFGPTSGDLSTRPDVHLLCSHHWVVHVITLAFLRFYKINIVTSSGMRAAVFSAFLVSPKVCQFLMTLRHRWSRWYSPPLEFRKDEYEC